MNKTLPEILADILTLYGAIVSNGEDENGLEYLASKELAEQLRIPEYGKIGFSPDLPGGGGEIIPGHYDSELFRSLESFLGKKGKVCSVAVPPFFPNTEKTSRVIASSIGFSNATFRLQSTEQGRIPYILIVFKFVGLSDDKKEGLCAVMVNALTLSTRIINEDQAEEILRVLQDYKSEAVPGGPDIKMDILRAAHSAAAVAVEEKLNDFTKSLERRLNRDITRVYGYYETLKGETIKLIEKAGKNSDAEEIKKKSGKLDAIELEKKWKIKDLVSKYTLLIDIKPVCVTRIETRSTLFWININRRNETRPFPLTYNSLLKQLDTLPCEACFYPKGSYSVCDARLHIVSGDCFKACPQCQKKYCGACYRNGCPKCCAE